MWIFDLCSPVNTELFLLQNEELPGRQIVFQRHVCTRVRINKRKVYLIHQTCFEGLVVHRGTADDPRIFKTSHIIQAGDDVHVAELVADFRVRAACEHKVLAVWQTVDATDVPVLYEDEEIVVINKPAGVLTHAKGGISQEHTVADMLQPLTTFASDTNRAGIVHRLDRETSGVLVGARTPAAAEFLQKQFAQRTTKKTYIAIVEGVPKHTEALIDLPIGRSPAKPSTFRVDPKGKSAQTTYYVLDVQNGKSLVKLQPKTGRTHQLRVHMAHIGHPIVGDIVYGTSAQRMFLHAYQLELTAPNGERMTFTAPVPEEFLRNFPEVEL